MLCAPHRLPPAVVLASRWAVASHHIQTQSRHHITSSPQWIAAWTRSSANALNAQYVAPITATSRDHQQRNANECAARRRQRPRRTRRRRRRRRQTTTAIESAAPRGISARRRTKGEMRLDKTMREDWLSQTTTSNFPSLIHETYKLHRCHIPPPSFSAVIPWTLTADRTRPSISTTRFAAAPLPFD